MELRCRLFRRFSREDLFVSVSMGECSRIESLTALDTVCTSLQVFALLFLYPVAFLAVVSFLSLSLSLPVSLFSPSPSFVRPSSLRLSHPCFLFNFILAALVYTREETPRSALSFSTPFRVTDLSGEAFLAAVSLAGRYSRTGPWARLESLDT